MAELSRGKRTKLTGQVGEHLVSAMLGMKGYYATPYAGNVPGFDLSVVNASTLESFPVQVKTSTGGAILQSTITKWAEINIDKKTGKQKYLRPKVLDHPDMIWIFVQLSEDLNNCLYIICQAKDIQKAVINGYRKWMCKHNWIRPRNPFSKHCALLEKDLSNYIDNWELLEQVSR